MVTPDQLISKKAQTTYNYYRSKISEYEQSNAIKVSRLDTVGALAIDDEGNIAAGCSSGGIILKLQGRVGHAAVFGSGVWAQKSGNQSTGCVTTGNGEYLIKTLLAREICTNLVDSQCPTTKLNQILNEKFLKSPLLPQNNDLEYYAGALVIDYNSETKRGELLWAHTTKMLCLGYKSSSSKSAKFVSSSLPDQSQAGRKVVVQGITF
jgi:taspase, threonine aspartase, 1